MEDFSTIIWALVIIGAMVYNAAAKARKARAKGEQASPQHGEAWPSIPWETEKKPPRNSDPTRQPEPTNPKRLSSENQPVLTAFPDECQSLEEIPAAMYRSENDRLATKTPVRSESRGLRTDSIPQTTEAADRENKFAKEENSLGHIDELVEEFDLRRAVIYSEILKPKFEE